MLMTLLSHLIQGKRIFLCQAKVHKFVVCAAYGSKQYANLAHIIIFRYTVYLWVSIIISSRDKLAGHCCDCFCDHFGDQEMLLALHFQDNNVLQRTLWEFARYAFLALSYQYQMRAVEDLVADCASIASVHILFLDLSRLGKPSEHMTVGM